MPNPVRKERTASGGATTCYGSRRLRWPARSSWESLLPQRLRLQTLADLVNQRT
jgi:hypothetical protein